MLVREFVVVCLLLARSVTPLEVPDPSLKVGSKAAKGKLAARPTRTTTRLPAKGQRDDSSITARCSMNCRSVTFGSLIAECHLPE